MTQDVVIVGAGQAGGELAVQLRYQGYAGDITLIGDEPNLPYKRSRLSSSYLAGTHRPQQLLIHPKSRYDSLKIGVMKGAQVMSIDRQAKRITFAMGSSLPYDKLVLATGAYPRPLSLQETAAPNVYSLRTMHSVNQLRAKLQPGQRIAIIGGSYAALEAAAVANQAGLAVTVIDAMPGLLTTVTGEFIADYLTKLHRSNGVDIRLGVEVAGLKHHETNTTLILSDGSRLEADLVVVDLEQVANTQLAEESGIECDNGILTDNDAVTSDPDILAIGGCARASDARYDSHSRRESRPNAIEEAKAVAAAICGKAYSNQAIPVFCLEQFGTRLQTVGIWQTCDETVVRGQPGSNQFTVFYLRDSQVIAADCVNEPDGTVLAKQLIRSHVKVSAKQLADERIEVTKLAQSAA